MNSAIWIGYLGKYCRVKGEAPLFFGPRKALVGLLLPFCLFVRTGKVKAIDLSSSEANSEVFAKNYVLVESVRNYPASFSEERFDPGKFGWLLGFRHLLENHWMMSVGGSFKSLYHEERQKLLPILTINHEAAYVIRLQHPTYFLVGPKLLYLLPTTNMSIPLQRDPNYSAEVGVGISGTFYHLLTRKLAFHMRFERWRGTGSMLFHGIEMAAGVNFAVGEADEP